jgi:DNA-binding CsgD family transcriptional regulator
METWPDILPPDLYRTLFTGITDAVTVIDRHFRIVWANEQRAITDYRLRCLSGIRERAAHPRYSLHEMVGHKCHEKFRRRSTPCPQCPSVTVFQTGEHCVVERRIDLPGGVKKWAETRAYPIRARNGEVELVVKISSEITGRKQNEDRRQRYIETMERLLADAAREPMTPPANEAALLTAREKQVLRLLAQGLSNPEIAHALHISPHTAKRHVANIFAKIAVRDRAQAALWASRNGVV